MGQTVPPRLTRKTLSVPERRTWRLTPIFTSYLDLVATPHQRMP